MYTLSICPMPGKELDLYHRNGKTFVHGRREAKLQPGLGRRRQVTTSQPQPMFTSLILS
jgi:hypothetical protein